MVSLAHLRLLALPTCVGLRYGRSLMNTRNEVFLGSGASTIPGHPEGIPGLSVLRHVNGGFTCHSPYDLRSPIPAGDSPSFLRHSIAINQRFRNINLMSIGYAFRPRLRIRLTPGGRSCPRETLGFRCPEFSSGFSLLIPA